MYPSNCGEREHPSCAPNLLWVPHKRILFILARERQNPEFRGMNAFEKRGLHTFAQKKKDIINVLMCKGGRILFVFTRGRGVDPLPALMPLGKKERWGDASLHLLQALPKMLH